MSEGLSDARKVQVFRFARGGSFVVALRNKVLKLVGAQTRIYSDKICHDDVHECHCGGGKDISERK